MTRRLTFPLLLALISLTGCAVEGNIVPAKTSVSGFDKAFYSGREIERNPNPEGYEEYRIFHQGATGFTPQTAVRNSAIARATEFCAKQGKGMRILSEHRATGAKILGIFPRVELIFVCPPKVEQAAPVSKYDNLLKAMELLDKGVLTQDEFEREKRKILDGSENF